MADTQPAMTYPAEEQYEEWKRHADELDMSVSEFMQAMVEAGRRKFDRDVSPDETPQELREQRNELREELRQSRDRIQELEDRVYNSERRAIVQFVEDNGATDFESIVEHVQQTARTRVNQHIDAMQGDEIRIEQQRLTDGEDVYIQEQEIYPGDSE